MFLHHFDKSQGINDGRVVIKWHCEDQTLASSAILRANIRVDIGALTPVDCGEALRVHFTQIAQAFLHKAKKFLITFLSLETFYFVFDAIECLLKFWIIVKVCVKAGDS